MDQCSLPAWLLCKWEEPVSSKPREAYLGTSEE